MAKSTKSTKKKQTGKSSPMVASQSETVQETQFFSPILRLLILGILFCVAFGIRVYHITEPPLFFHPGRQYHSATIARALYFNASKSIPVWRRQVANINAQKESVREPRIMEHIASFAYRIAGAEHLWIPRLMSSIFWLIGGAFLYLLVKKIFSADAAVFSTAFYLFLPYGIIASRSFQPNPLMVMMLVVSILTIFRYYDHPSTKMFVTAIASSALTMFIYPFSLFFIFGAFISLAFYRYGIRRAIINPKFLLFLFISVLPTVIYYGYGIFIGKFLKGYAQGSFLPHILVKSYFWEGWLAQIERAVGFPAMIGAIVGVFMLRKGLAKAMMIGLWTGYFAYSLIFTYQMHTHSYYQLPFVVIVTISLGSIGVLVANRLSETCKRLHWRVLVLAVISLAVLLSINKAKKKLYYSYFQYIVKTSEEIGAAVGHSTETIFLAHYSGKPLVYHGEISGIRWPSLADLRAKVKLRERVPSVEECFDNLCSKYSPKYFIVTNFQELKGQPGLKEFLAQNFPVLVNNRNYLIFDLRKRLKKDG